jgi:hypothetical protein
MPAEAAQIDHSYVLLVGTCPVRYATSALVSGAAGRFAPSVPALGFAKIFAFA